MEHPFTPAEALVEGKCLGHLGSGLSSPVQVCRRLQPWPTPWSPRRDEPRAAKLLSQLWPSETPRVFVLLNHQAQQWMTSPGCEARVHACVCASVIKEGEGTSVWRVPGTCSGGLPLCTVLSPWSAWQFACAPACARTRTPATQLAHDPARIWPSLPGGYRILSVSCILAVLHAHPGPLQAVGLLTNLSFVCFVFVAASAW